MVDALSGYSSESDFSAVSDDDGTYLPEGEIFANKSGKHTEFSYENMGGGL